MLLSTEDAREVTDKVEVSEIPTRHERDVFAFLGVMVAEAKAITPKNAYRAAKAQAPGLAATILEIGRMAVADDFDKAAPIDDVIGLYREWNLRREIGSILEHRKRELEEGVLHAETIVANLATAAERIQNRRHDNRSFDDLDEQLNRVGDYLANPVPAGIPFGFSAIDRAVVPLLDGNLCLIGGPSGSGKSTIARNLFKNWRNRQPVYFSLEMTADDQLLHLECMDCNIPVADAVKRTLNQRQQEDMKLAGLAYKRAGVRINERSNLSPVELMRALKRYRAAGHRLFIVDHMHRMDYGGEKDLRIAMGNAFKALKSWAVDSQSIVVALVQLTKQSRKEEPDDSSIRESGQLLEESDRAFLTWRPLVMGRRNALGDFEPFFPRKIIQPGVRLGKDAVAGEDNSRIYIKPGKQRIAPVDTLFIIKFNHKSGQMYDAPDRED